jgi:hypothetical protein
MRETHPERYIETAAKLIMTAEQADPNSFATANSMTEVGVRLLKSVGVTDEDAMTPEMIQAAVDAQDRFITELSQIAAGH